MLLKLTVCALLALLMTAVLIFPTLFYLNEGIRNTVQTTESNFSFTKFLAKLFNGVYFNRSFVNTTKSVYPHVYSGILSLVVVPTFFLSKQITRRERFIYGMIFLFIVISFFIPEVGNIWHAFVYPTGFPYRFAFLFSFLSIYLTARALDLGLWETKKILISCIFWSVILGYLLVVQEINFALWFWNQLLLVLLAVITLFIEGVKWYSLVWIMLVVVIFGEVTMHQIITLKKVDRATPFTLYDKTINQALTEFDVYQEYWEPLKKVTSTYASFDTDNLYYDFPSVSGFSSMTNKKYLLMLTKLGYSTSNVRAKRNGGTAITDILLSNQYQVIPKERSQETLKNYQQVMTQTHSSLYQTKYENPIGLLFDDQQISTEVPNDLQQRIIASLGGILLNIYVIKKFSIKRLTV